MDKEKNIEAIQEKIRADKEGNGYKNKIYKAASEDFKKAELSKEIMARLPATDIRQSKVDLNNLAEVSERTQIYLEACANEGAYPSVMGLSVYGFGISRQALNQFMLRNPEAPTTDYIHRVKDIMADILTNQSLKNNCNPVQAIFQLKNHFEHTDKIEEIIPYTEPLGKAPTTAEIMERYSDLPDD